VSEQNKRTSYQTDLSDKEWQKVETCIPKPKTKRGRKRQHSLRELINAIFYVVRSGCAWRLLPHDFPPWKTVYHYFCIWRLEGIWECMNVALRTELRIAEGRNSQPSAAIIDSQSVKTTETRGVRGYDAGKKVNGRKRHILVDTMGLLLMVVVHTANIQDRDGARILLEGLAEQEELIKRLKLIWADGGYRGALVAWVEKVLGWKLEIVEKPEGQVGFQILPRRWVVERTFGWLVRQRRLARDYERLPETSEAFIYIAMIRLMVRQLACT